MRRLSRRSPFCARRTQSDRTRRTGVERAESAGAAQPGLLVVDEAYGAVRRLVRADDDRPGDTSGRDTYLLETCRWRQAGSATWSGRRRWSPSSTRWRCRITSIPQQIAGRLALQFTDENGCTRPPDRSPNASGFGGLGSWLSTCFPLAPLCNCSAAGKAGSTRYRQELLDRQIPDS